MTRASMLDVLAQDYVRTARAKGLVERQVLFVPCVEECRGADRHDHRHRLRLADRRRGRRPRAVFAIPGLGRLTVDAILRRDYPVIQGVVLLFGSPMCWSISPSI